jgi:CheY-like chemotaxis protein
MGVDIDQLPYLFDPFVRVEDEDTKKIEGSGLGLSIAKELAEMMNGVVSVKSKKGAGSTFTLTIPQQIAFTSQLDSEKEYSSVPMFTAVGSQILVTDDHPANLKLLCEMLSSAEISVDTACSGDECIRFVKQKHYDAILMDYMMPVMDGVETLRRLQKMEDFHTPVIAVTANVVAGTRETLQKAGFVRYISKPVSLSNLYSALIDVLPENRIKLIASDMPNANQPINLEVIYDLLGDFGIDLNDGLEFLCGDITQYRQFAEIFSEGYQDERAEMENAFAGADFQTLRHKAHSLKSRAAQIGANDLSATAARIEQQCRRIAEHRLMMKDDENACTELIRLLLPILFFEWQQAIEVLHKMEVHLSVKTEDFGR